jgi:hypothetical protein
VPLTLHQGPMGAPPGRGGSEVALEPLLYGFLLLLGLILGVEDLEHVM